MTNRRRTDSGRDAGTFVALAALLVAALGLLLLVALVMPQVLGIAIVLGGLLLFGTFHYAVWGWWMSGRGTIEQDGPDDPATRWQPPVD